MTLKADDDGVLRLPFDSMKLGHRFHEDVEEVHVVIRGPVEVERLVAFVEIWKLACRPGQNVIFKVVP